MTEEQIITWMDDRINKGNFQNAASLAQEFCQTHDITDTLDPDFSRTISAGFALAQKIATL